MGSIRYDNKDKSIEYRIYAWQIALKKIKQHPILGYGAGADSGVEDPFYKGEKRKFRTIHNGYLETAVWGGFSTVLFFLATQFLIVKYGIKEIMLAPPQLTVYHVPLHGAY